MRKNSHDPRQMTLDELFELPRPVEPTPASLDTGNEIRHLLSTALKQTTKSRFEVCARMSELVGHNISISMLNAWTAESREAWRFPLEYAAAFEVACETFAITEFLARKRGCKVYAGDEVRQAEIGRLESQMSELASKLKQLKKVRITG
ncbi:hypothetical protein [Geomonas propionica]|uniref:Uncharacterized protein n=1 Tax=Geomonas propionica TaxID=2798582 RepID=A0ABS0YQE7_9BACT|nr:hypothetical protein [Geomonas propionica]MBJ6800204.1 hypothetical protein [Geomonas propionica]